MANENNFKETVNSLFKGMDSFISAKTVVGEAIHVGVLRQLDNDTVDLFTVAGGEADAISLLCFA